MTADEFLDVLERKSLLPAETLATLRAQVSKSLKIVSADTIAELLVSKKRLTAGQAQELLHPTPAAAAMEDDFGLAPLDDELLLAPLDDKPAKPQAAVAPTQAAKAAAPAAKAPAATSAAAKTTGKAPAAKSPATKGPATPAKPAGKPVAKPSTPAPLDDLFSSALVSEAGPAALNGPALARRRRSGMPRWAWWAIGGGVAVLVIIVAVVILTRSNGDGEWKLAEKDYSAGADQDAIYKLDAFLERFPRHPQAGLAKVYRGMAELRLSAAEAKDDATRTLTTAERVLPDISTRRDFSKVRDGLAKILPDMADKLVKKAKDATKAPLDERRQLADRAAKGVALLQDWRYIPDADRPWGQVQTLNDAVASLNRSVERDAKRDAVTTEIRAAVAAGDIGKVTAALDALTSAFPELVADNTAATLGEEIVGAAAKLITVSEEKKKAETKPRPSPLLGSVPIDARDKSLIGSPGEDKSSEPPAGPETIAILWNGAVYFLTTKNGNLVGRQAVGPESVSPVSVDASGREFIVFDAVNKDLCRVAADGAALKWRQPLDDRIVSAPVLVGKRLLAATIGGRLLELDVDSGDVVRAAKFPIKLRAAPAVSPDGATLLLPADRDTLFTLSAKDFSVRGVTYLGYPSGAVTFPPLIVGRTAIIADTRNWESTDLVALTATDSPGRWKLAGKLTVAGRVFALAAVGGRIVAATDNGGVHLLEATGQAAEPLKRLDSAPAPLPFGVSAFLTPEKSGFWLAGPGLQHFEIGEEGKLKRDLALGGGQFVAPPVSYGEQLVFALHDPLVGGVQCVRSNVRGTPKPIWQTMVAAPNAGQPTLSADGRSLQLVNRLAFAPPVETSPPEKATFATGVVDFSGSRNGGQPVVEEGLASGDGRIAALVGVAHTSPRAVDPPTLWTGDGDHPLKPGDLPVAAVAPMVRLGDGLLIASRSGQLHWLSDDQKQHAALGLQSGAELASRWQRPAVIPGKSEFIVADGAARLVRIGLKAGSPPSLELIAEAPLATPLASPLAINGEQAVAVTDKSEIVAFGVTDLKPAKSLPLKGALAWGPIVADKLTLIATGSELVALDDKLEPAWRVAAPATPPIGVAASGKQLILATSGGEILLVDRASGDSKPLADLHQSLAQGPIITPKAIIVCGADGTVHYVKGP